MREILWESDGIVKYAEKDKQRRARLEGLAELKTSPVLPMVFDKIDALMGQKHHPTNARVGITTRESVKNGSEPALCIVLNQSRYGRFGNEFNPSRWDFERVDLVASQKGDKPLGIKVVGYTYKYGEPPTRHSIDDMSAIERALDIALAHPRDDSIPDYQNLKDSFPVVGYKPIRNPKVK